MDLLPSTDQEQILDTLRTFLADQAPVGRLRDHGAIGNPDARLWPELGALGFIGLGLPEDQGGIGLTTAEEALVYREFGRHLISPAVLGLTLGARIVANAGDATLREDFLSGAARVGIANPRGAVTLGARCSGDFHLFDADTAAWVLVIGQEGAGLFRREDFAAIVSVPATDAVITLERARLDDVAPRLWMSDGDDPLHARALLLLAAYAVGLAEGTRDMAVDYAKVREQFGKPIGSFQAIKHICATMAVRAEAAHCQACFASLVLADHGADSDFHATAAKIVATDSALKNSAETIQVLGAFGFTSEANAHHYLKRAHLIDLLWGDLRSQRARLLQMPTPA